MLLPDNPANYAGMDWVIWYTAVFAVITTARSLIHVFLPDGGAQSIAGINIHVEGGRNLVTLFAQWGLMQLLMAAVVWVAVIHYQGLLPLVLLLSLIENVGRIGIGFYKPLDVEKPPPGAYGSYLYAVTLIPALICSLL